MASQPVLCKGATSTNAILPLSISDAGALNIAAAAALGVTSTQLPTTIGRTNMAGSTSVVLASDQPSVPVSMTQSAASSSSTLSIAAGATDTSVSKDTAGYSKIGILVSSDQTDTTVQLKFSHDNSTWFAVEAAQGVGAIAEIGGGSAQNTLYFNASPLAKYVRVDVKHSGTGTAAVTVLSNLH